MSLRRLPGIAKNSFESSTLIVLSLISLLAGGCADPHFMPRERPLFAGLDETAMSAAARQALGQAKEDFQKARHDDAPVHARFDSVVPHSHSRVYLGDGYKLTLVHSDFGYGHADGPEIVIEPRITGGRPYHYDEIDRPTD